MEFETQLWVNAVIEGFSACECKLKENKEKLDQDPFCSSTWNTWDSRLGQWATVQFLGFCTVCKICLTHPRSSPVHPQGDGEAERAVKTIKILLNMADDKYIALLNYRSTPLQRRSSPAELLMGRKLRTKIPTLPVQHIPEGKDAKQFQDIDAKLKQRQKETIVSTDRRTTCLDQNAPRLTGCGY